MHRHSKYCSTQRRENQRYLNGWNRWRPVPLNLRGPSGFFSASSIRLKHLARYLPCWAATWIVSRWRIDKYMCMITWEMLSSYVWKISLEDHNVQKSVKHLCCCREIFHLRIHFRKSFLKFFNVQLDSILGNIPFGLFQQITKITHLLILQIQLHLRVPLTNVLNDFLKFFDSKRSRIVLICLAKYSCNIFLKVLKWKSYLEQNKNKKIIQEELLYICKHNYATWNCNNKGKRLEVPWLCAG